MKSIFKQISLLLLCLLASTRMYAEYNHEFGLVGGTAFYLGDANHKTPFAQSRWSAGALYRYNFDTRWALKVQGTYAEVAGDSRQFGYVFPTGQAYATFSRQLFNLDVATEFNFFDIGECKYYKAHYKATPYILLGVGMTIYEGHGPKALPVHVSIPFGIGGKWKATRRLTLGVEWSIHKLFADDLDVTGSDNAILYNPNKTGKVGFLDTDWFSYAQVYISFNLFDTNKFCK